MVTYVDDGAERLESSENSLNSDTIVKHERCGSGRREGDTEIPDFLRPVIGAAARASGSMKAAKAFGVSQPSALAMSKGKKHPTAPVDPELKANVNGRIADARDKAVEGVMAALNIIPGKLDDSVKLKDLAGVARDLATVVDKLAPIEEKVQKGNQVIFMLPKERDVADYPVIEVSSVVEE